MKSYLFTLSYGAPGSGAARFEKQLDGNTVLDAISNGFENGDLSEDMRLSKVEVCTVESVPATSVVTGKRVVFTTA